MMVFVTLDFMILLCGYCILHLIPCAHAVQVILILLVK